MIRQGQKERRKPIRPQGLPALASRTINLLSIRRQLAWLRRAPTWRGFPRKYKGVKILGAGTYGICGLFEYRGNDQQRGDRPTEMVIKQSRARDHLWAESTFLRKFTHLGSEHIVKLYKDVVREGGTGTTDNSGFDPYPFHVQGGWIPNREIERMYMEYCPGGDLSGILRSDWFRNSNTARRKLPEEYIWRVLDCLSSAMIMMSRGSEDPTVGVWNEEPVAHFDLKPQNGRTRIFQGCYNHEPVNQSRQFLSASTTTIMDDCLLSRCEDVVQT